MKKIWIIILLFGSVSCTDNLDYLNSIASSDEDSSSRYRRRRATRSTNQCENSKRCENICDQILDYTAERKLCYKMSLKEIGTVEEVFDDLQDPERYLNNIRGGDFDLFASVALRSWSNLIRGEYRRDERDDEDRDGDDPGRSAYSASTSTVIGEAEKVFKWIVDNKSIAESIRDFSERDVHIISDLLIQMNQPLSCNPNDSTCSQIKSSLNSSEQKILEGIRDNYNTNTSLLSRIADISSSTKEVSAMYELTHNILSRTCESADSLTIGGKNYGSDHSYKICLSWIYFCSPQTISGYSSNRNQIDQYLLRDTYRKTAESSLTGCTFTTTPPRWSDYWN